MTMRTSTFAMTSGPRRTVAALVAAGALALTGCGSQTEEAQTSGQAAVPAGHEGHDHDHQGAAPSAPSAPSATAQESGAAAAAAVEPEGSVPVDNPPAELPPGDPGLDAEGVPDPGRPQGERHDDHGHARTVVPAEAMLDAGTVAGVLGGQWQESAAQPLDCLSGAGWVAERSVSFTAADGNVLQTVATHRSLDAADRAVDQLGRQLADCGWTGEPDPRLGTNSQALSNPDGGQVAVLMAAEGVTVTVVGSTSATEQRGRWTSLLDVALGNSCAAAPHGCH